MKRSIKAALLFAGAMASAGWGQSINDLVFIHHSCGANWLSDSLHAALVAKGYIDERNDIYYGIVVAPDANRPDSLGSIPGNNTNMNHWVLWFNDYLGGVRSRDCASGFNRIVMFKSCFPISDITADGTEPGNPFSGTQQTITNYKAVYRHPNGAGNTYLYNGYTYRPLEDIFAANPDILFIPVTAPPLCYTCTSDQNAHRARLFNNWLKNVWLASYRQAHPGLNNVAVFDWFDVLAYEDAHPAHPNRLKGEYGGGGTDSHPNSTANSYSTVVFAGGEDNFIDAAWGHYCRDYSGDAIVAWPDVEFFAAYWLDDTCEASDWCGGTDLNTSAAVDMNDWALFAGYWATRW